MRVAGFASRVLTLFSTLSSVSDSFIYPDEPQPPRVQPSSPTDNSNSSSPSGPDATDPAPEVPSSTPGSAPGPASAPQPRSWFASLSRRGSSNLPLNEVVKQATSSPPGEQLAGAQPPPSATTAAMPPPHERPDTVPTNLPLSEPHTVNPSHPETDIGLTPRKRAWFGSSSPSKRSSKLQPWVESSPHTDSTRTDPPVPEIPLPTTNVIPPTPPRPVPTQVEGEPPSEAVPVLIPAARYWFSPTSPLQSRSPEVEVRAVSPLAPDSQAGVTSSCTPSSIDDRVPKLPSAGPPLESVSPSVMVSTDTSQNLYSLNPSASRFSLNFPFLARSKVSLDRAIASAPASHTQTEPDVPSAPSKDLPEMEKEEPTLETTGEGFAHLSMTTCERSRCVRNSFSRPCSAFRAKFRARC